MKWTIIVCFLTTILTVKGASIKSNYYSSRKTPFQWTPYYLTEEMAYDQPPFPLPPYPPIPFDTKETALPPLPPGPPIPFDTKETALPPLPPGPPIPFDTKYYQPFPLPPCPPIPFASKETALPPLPPGPPIPFDTKKTSSFEQFKSFFEDVSLEEMERRTNFPETQMDENGLPEGSVLVDGDILISKENLHLWESGQYMASDQAWGNFPMWKNPISIGIDRQITASPKLLKWTLESILEIQNKTCLKFKAIKKAINGPYMMVKLTGRCYATFGQQFPRENVVGLGRSCTRSRTPAHEIIHSLGRFHEQTRMDRDKYIRLNQAAISCPEEYSKRPSNTLRIPYDYYSVMHYSVNSCSKGGQPTMAFPKGVDASRVGRESWLTPSDINHIKRRYCQSG